MSTWGGGCVTMGWQPCPRGVAVVSPWGGRHISPWGGSRVPMGCRQCLHRVAAVSPWDGSRVPVGWWLCAHGVAAVSPWGGSHASMGWRPCAHGVVAVSPWGGSHDPMGWRRCPHEVAAVSPWVGGRVPMRWQPFPHGVAAVSPWGGGRVPVVSAVPTPARRSPSACPAEPSVLDGVESFFRRCFLRSTIGDGGGSRPAAVGPEMASGPSAKGTSLWGWGPPMGDRKSVV